MERGKGGDAGREVARERGCEGRGELCSVIEGTREKD
jgi:hypothetical protein